MSRINRIGFFLIKASRIRIHILNIEVLCKFGKGEDVTLVGDSPSEKSKIVEQTLWNEAAVTVVEQIRLWVSLGKFFISLTHHIWQVTEARDELCDTGLKHRVVKRNLARR